MELNRQSAPVENNTSDYWSHRDNESLMTATITCASRDMTRWRHVTQHAPTTAESERVHLELHGGIRHNQYSSAEKETFQRSTQLQAVSRWSQSDQDDDKHMVHNFTWRQPSRDYTHIDYTQWTASWTLYPRIYFAVHWLLSVFIIL